MNQLLTNLGWSKIIIGGLAVVVVGGAATVAVVKQRQPIIQPSTSVVAQATPTPTPTPSPSVVSTPAAKSSPKTSPAASPTIEPAAKPPATATASFQFSRLPFDPENVGAISPIGDFGSVSRSQTGSGHPYGNERHFIWHKQPLGRALYNVYAPGDGTITRFKMTNAPPYGLQYQLYFQIDANRMYYLAHINKLDPGLETKLSQALGGQLNETSAPQEVKGNITVKAGDVIGQTGATAVNWDWGLIDDSYSQGLTDPSHYSGLNAGHSRSVYDLSSDSVKAQLRQLAGIWNSVDQTFKPRVGDPPLGILGSDVKGTLSGGWFQTYDFNPYPHIAIFSPYAYDTSKLQIMLEIPDLDLFGKYEADDIQVLGNASLNPSAVKSSSGIVGYYLKGGGETGVLLVRVNDDETLTLEGLKGAQTMPDNVTFSSKALTLKR